MLLGKLRNAFSSPVHKKFNGVHDCGPRALCKVLPSLKWSSVHKAFSASASLWPNCGVSNEDMNKAIKILKLEKRFEYKKHGGEPIGSFIDNSKDSFIILIENHYAVIINRKVVDDPLLHRDIKVYHSWRLLKPTEMIRYYFKWRLS